jgi:hypothetical protein
MDLFIPGGRVDVSSCTTEFVTCTIAFNANGFTPSSPILVIVYATSTGRPVSQLPFTANASGEVNGSFSFSGLADVYQVQIVTATFPAVEVVNFPEAFRLNQRPGGNSLTLNGTTAYAEALDAPKLHLAADYTLELWFKDESPLGFNHEFRTLVSKGDRQTSPESPLFVSVGYKHLRAGLRTGWRDVNLDYDLWAARVDPSAWHHVALTIGAASRTLTLYLDGVQVSQETVPSLSKGSNMPLQVGRDGAASGKYFQGKLDDLRIWSVARSSSEIAANYRAELTTSPAGLVANWQFNESGGTSAADRAAPADGATLHGGATFTSDRP